MSDELVMEVQPVTLLAPTGKLRWVQPYKVVGDLFSQTMLHELRYYLLFNFLAVGIVCSIAAIGLRMP